MSQPSPTKTADFMLKEDRDLLAARREKWRCWWERARKRGKLRFILVRYVLAWGGTLVLLNVSLNAFSHPDWLHGADATYAYGGSAFTLLIGYLLGLWEWHSNEKRYRRG
jgi:hypothetical protein